MVEPDLFSLQDEKAHGARRRNVANGYALSTLLGVEEYVDRCSALHLLQFSKFAQENQLVDISPWLQYYAFDVVDELGICFLHFISSEGLEGSSVSLNKGKILDGLTWLRTFYFIWHGEVYSSMHLT
jgi:hypothetical protein